MAGKWYLYGAALLLVQAIVACAPEAPVPEGQNSAKQGGTKPALSGAEAENPALVVAFGDSLFAGYGLAQDEGFAPALRRALKAQGVTAHVFNAGVSGDTSAAGRQRLGFMLDGLTRTPDLVIVGLGANDMLRGLSPEATRANLDAILSDLAARGIPAMLAGMLAAPNMGPEYAAAFNPIYPDLAKKHGLALDPFVLDGVIGKRELLLADGIHPNAQGAEIMAARIAPMVAASMPPP